MFFISNINSIAHKIDDRRKQDKACIRLFQLYSIRRKMKLAPEIGYKYFNITNKKMWEAGS